MVECRVGRHRSTDALHRSTGTRLCNRIGRCKATGSSARKWLFPEALPLLAVCPEVRGCRLLRALFPPGGGPILGVWRNAQAGASLVRVPGPHLSPSKRPLPRQRRAGRTPPPSNWADWAASRAAPPAPASSPGSSARRSPARRPRPAGPSTASRERRQVAAAASLPLSLFVTRIIVALEQGRCAPAPPALPTLRVLERSSILLTCTGTSQRERGAVSHGPAAVEGAGDRGPAQSHL